MSWYKPGPRAVYLYDGVHAEDHDGMITLSTQRGSDLHFICFEDRLIEEFLEYLEKARGLKITVSKATGGVGQKEEVHD